MLQVAEISARELSDAKPPVFTTTLDKPVPLSAALQLWRLPKTRILVVIKPKISLPTVLSSMPEHLSTSAMLQ
ncbi:hypothetical protein GN958_ATG06821 [Phytophthora infestans]|uniref:Uncharacterized protein n=1 Tax=Phytophthora infestans TaxID=4787 RepID=A0A8S9USJ1_PHYIN|nr:hypothetical protein GN958_ATG06821 [Phytophthora infestans]